MPTPAPLEDIAERLSHACQAIARNVPVQYLIQNNRLNLDEAFAVDGMLPLFIAMAARREPTDPALRFGYIIDKKAVCEAIPVVPARSGSGVENKWLARLRAVLEDMASLAEKHAGAVELEGEYDIWFANIQKLQYPVGGSREGLWSRLAADMKDTDEEPEPGEAGADGYEARPPQVSRREIAGYLAAPLAGRMSAMRARLRRPICFLVQHPFGDFEGDLARALAKDLEGRRDHQENDLVVASGEFIAGDSKAPVMKADALVDRLSGGGLVAVVCATPDKLPADVRELFETTLHIERFDAAGLAAALQALYELELEPEIPDGPWVRLVRPRDFLVNAHGGDALVADIRRSVERRLALVGAEQALSLEDLHGMPEAKAWANQLIADLRLAELGPLRGGIAWEDVDRGALFEGPPGVGKTSIARAIAKACGIKFINASAASWQAAGNLDAHLRAMRESFAMAAEYAPAILFIDEIDSIGSRESLSGDNAQYHLEVINALLQELDGFDTRARVIVLAATNYADKVDPALRRAGRLDRVIHIPYPNADGLKGIYRHYLARVAHELDEAAIDQLARASLGLTGADVELFIRGAKRSARRQGRKAIHQQDLLEQVYRTPPENERQPISPADLRRTAVHEAGHALAQLLQPGGDGSVHYVSVVPRSDGTLGFVATDGERATPHGCLEDVMRQVRTLLAGRAAEALVYGEEQVSGGAGGQSRRCDLARAAAKVEYLLTRQGLGSDSGLLWREVGLDDDASLRQAADHLLGEQYTIVKALLADHRARLDGLVDWLVERQEITGENLRRLLDGALPGP